MKKIISLITCILIFTTIGCTTLTTLLDEIRNEPEENSNEALYNDIADNLNKEFLKFFSEGIKHDVPYNKLDEIYRNFEMLPVQLNEKNNNPNQTLKEKYKLYLDIKVTTQFLKDIVSFWEKHDYGEDVKEILKTKYPATYQYSLMTDENFSKLVDLRKKVYSDGYYSEVALAEKEILDKYGLKIDARINQMSCNDLLSFCHSGNYPENIIYLIGSPFKVMQTIEDGVLISHFDSYGNSYIAFLETEKQYYDEYRFSKYILGIHRGAFKYSSLTGTRTVPRLIEIELQNKYYFLFP